MHKFAASCINNINTYFPALLQCHDPPLEDEDIPEGDWICIKCFSSKPDLATKVTAAASSAASSTESQADAKKKLQVS